MSNIVFRDNSQAIIEKLDRNKIKVLEMIGSTAEGYAKLNITDQDAVDTGTLRNSITHTIDSDSTVHIGTNVSYAPYVEFGTGRYSTTGGGTIKDHWVYQDDFGNYHTAHPMKPRPFLAPAISQHLREYRKMIEDILGK